MENKFLSMEWNKIANRIAKLENRAMKELTILIKTLANSQVKKNNRKT